MNLFLLSSYLLLVSIILRSKGRKKDIRTMSICCPPGSLGPAPLNERTPEGKVVTWNPIVNNEKSETSSSSTRKPLSCYQVGPDNPRRIIVVFTDVYGINSGNHKVFCDVLQQKMGDDTAVYCPDLFRGSPLMHQFGLPDFINASLGGLLSIYWGLLTRCSATNIDADLTQIVEPNVKQSGCELVGCTGFCLGGWVVGRCLALNMGRSMFAAGVGIHPSFQPERFAVGGTSPMDLAKGTQNKPILLLPAKEDFDMKPSSPLVKTMAKRRAKTPDQLSIPFDLPHGFVARGDFMGPTFKEGQEKVIQLTVDFFQHHLKL